MDSGNVGSEGLGLGGGPVLSLEGLGHRLVGHLAGSTVHGSSVDGGMDNRSCMDDRAGHSVDNRANGVGNGVGNSMGNGDSLRVDSLAIVGDGGNVSINVIGSVRDVLSSAVREGDGVRSSPGSSAVVSLGSLEVGAGVVVGNGVLVGEGRDLVRVHLGNGMGNRVGNSVGNNRGMVGGGSVDDRGGVDNRAGNGMSNRVGDGMGNRVGNAVSNNSMGKSVANNSVGESMSDNSVGKPVADNSVGKSVTNDTVGNSSNNSSLSKVASKARLGGVAHGVRGGHGGNGGTEALGLAGSPDLTLEGLGH